jgi:hypothetical protein
VLDKAAGYTAAGFLVKEAIEIRLNTRNFNRDGGFTLSRSWYPVINTCYVMRKQGQAEQAVDSAYQSTWASA